MRATPSWATTSKSPVPLPRSWASSPSTSRATGTACSPVWTLAATTSSATASKFTEERAKTYDFTTPYGYIHTALAVRKDNEDIKSFEDLAGKTTANSLASTYMELAESYGATVQGIDTLEETIQLLTAGRIDATLNANVSFYDYLNVHPDADFKLVAQTEDASHVAIPIVKSEDSSFLDALNSAIDELRADGTLKELSEKYFGQDISSEN